MLKNVRRKSSISHKEKKKPDIKAIIKKYKNDMILGAALLIAALCLFLVFNSIHRSDGGMVQVKQDKKIIGTYSLDKDGEYEIKTYYGTNTLTVKDGYAYMSQSSCKDHLCEKMGKISRVGETIICLPNSVFIEVISGDNSDYDAVVQ